MGCPAGCPCSPIRRLEGWLCCVVSGAALGLEPGLESRSWARRIPPSTRIFSVVVSSVARRSGRAARPRDQQLGFAGSRNGSGCTASPDTTGSGPSDDAGPPTIHAHARRIVCRCASYWDCPRTHWRRPYSPPTEGALAPLGALLSSAGFRSLARRRSSLLLLAGRGASLLVGYRLLAEKARRSARIARLRLRHSGGVTRKANRCAMPVACPL